MPPKKRSVLWDYFEVTGKGDDVKCKICKKTFKQHSNTSNMKKHLDRNHPLALKVKERDEPDEPDNERGFSESASCAIEKQASDFPSATSSSMQSGLGLSEPVRNSDEHDQTSSSSKGPESAHYPECASSAPRKSTPRQLKLISKSGNLSEKEKQSIDRTLVKMIGVDLQPLSIVENAGFKEYSMKLQPLYSIPSRKTLTEKLIPHYVDEISMNIKDMLSETMYIATTTDIWSSDANKSFCTVTSHFIHNDVHKNFVLETKELPGSHTALNIANCVTGIFDRWEINEKVVAMVTDNGANVKAAVVNELKKNHVPCAAHTLNLCVTDSIQDNVGFCQVIKKAKKIVTFFKTSNLASDKLKEIQNQMKLPVLRVLQDVSTRWNSTLIMGRRLVEIKDPVCAALSHFPKAPESLDASEWQLLSDCIKVLEPVETMTEELSGEKYPTLSMTIPLIRSIQYALKNLNTETEYGSYLKNKLVESISNRFHNWETMHVAAKSTFLDPRFKKAVFGVRENGEMAEEITMNELELMLQTHNQHSLHNQEQNLQNEDGDCLNISEAKKKKIEKKAKFWKWANMKIEEKNKNHTPSTVVGSSLMIREYIELPMQKRSEDPLPFCVKQKNVIPFIYELQKKYLCIPATSVPSERLFSTAGLVINDRRNRLMSENLNNILFLHNNMN